MCALPSNAMGLSAVCDCGISWSYSLTILVGGVFNVRFAQHAHWINMIIILMGMLIGFRDLMHFSIWLRSELWNKYKYYSIFIQHYLCLTLSSFSKWYGKCFQLLIAVSFSEGVQLWLRVLSWWGERGCKYHYMQAIIGPTLNAGLVALWFYRGSGPVLLRNLYILMIFPLNPRMDIIM